MPLRNRGFPDFCRFLAVVGCSLGLKAQGSMGFTPSSRYLMRCLVSMAGVSSWSSVGFRVLHLHVSRDMFNVRELGMFSSRGNGLLGVMGL